MGTMAAVHPSPAQGGGKRGDGASLPSLRGVLTQGGRLHLVYQPRVNLRTLRAESMEALVRWVHPRWGVQRPAAFIPLAERSGDILQIGAWVIDEAVRQLAQWRTQYSALTVAVNVSPLQIDRGTVLPVLRDALRRHGVPASAVEIEVTEAMAIADEARAARTMRQLRSMGVRLTVDDFGKGFAGIGTLRWLPADVLKFDKSLIDGLRDRSERPRALLGALVAFAHGIGASCIAEGVETREQVQVLRSLGCDSAQGYFFSEPTEVAEFRLDYMGPDVRTSRALSAPR